MKSRRQRSLSVLAFILFMGIGSYNAVVINSQSDLGSDIRFVKRLDELYGVTVPGRLTASMPKWSKVKVQRVAAPEMNKLVVQEVSTVQAVAEPSVAVEEPGAAAAVKAKLTANVVEVVNPTLWQQGLPANVLEGSLSTEDGKLSVDVAIPNGEIISASDIDMSGNTFQYGDNLNGTIYQEDPTTYAIRLVDGPYAGTLMKFRGETAEQVEERETQEVANLGTNDEKDNFGQPTEQELAQADQPAPVEAQIPVPETQEAQAEPQPQEFAPVEPQNFDVAQAGIYIEQQAADLDMQYQQDAQNMGQPPVEALPN